MFELTISIDIAHTYWWVRNLWLSLHEDCHLPSEDIAHLLQSSMMKRNGRSNGHKMSYEFQIKII